MKLIDTTDDILSAFKDRNFSLKTWKIMRRPFRRI